MRNIEIKNLLIRKNELKSELLSYAGLNIQKSYQDIYLNDEKVLNIRKELKQIQLQLLKLDKAS